SQDESLENVCYHSISVILTSEKHTPGDVINELLDRYPWSSGLHGHICECLGNKNEQVKSGNLNELAEIKSFNIPNLLIIENHNPLKPGSSACFGRKDNQFDHDANMITHPEIRAVTLSKLMLKNNGVMWDIGAGSGSVGIEAALLAPLLRVYSIEKSKERSGRIIKNKEGHNAHNLIPVHGNAIDICSDLPAPDRIFFGGGGKDLYALLTFCYKTLKEHGVMVINTVTIEAFEAARSFCVSEAKDYDFVEIQVSRQHDLAVYHMLKPDNPVTIFTVKK
ncbi:MAG: precorrin-6Y C5,15-methyltransferase (decarboxylating) subunit CbiT, partial [Deltaproteobacteria bacterium]|nr:precorrin-6Y C5,15-methyltransferase (decarboxylating) subunit CbiT [Deltaproteobacteria bacterium]